MDYHLPLPRNNKEARSDALRKLGKPAFEIAVICLAYVIAGKLGQATSSIRSSNLGPVWPAFGVALAGILVYGYRAAIGVLAGAFIVAFFSPVSHLAAVGQACGATIAATIGAFVLRRVRGFDSGLSRLSDTVALIVFGGLGSAMVSATLGTFFLYLSDVHPYSGYGLGWLIYWLGDATGVLLVTPLVLTFRDFAKSGYRASIPNAITLLLLLLVSCFVIFGDLPFVPMNLHVMPFAVIPFVIWAAMHFGTSGASLSVLIIAAVATVETAYGSGPFVQSTPFQSAILLDVFFAVLAITGMIVAAAITERENLLRERVTMEAQLRNEESLHESANRLKKSEEKFAKAFRESPVSVILASADSHNFHDVNRTFERLSGWQREEVIGRSPVDLGMWVDPAQRTNFVERIQSEGSIHDFEVRYRCKDRTERIGLGSAELIEVDGEACILAVLADITERKRAEEALSQLSQKLIHAQEQERTRIARDLHDDIAQRLALLAVEVQAFQQDLSGSESEYHQRAGKLFEAVVELSNEVHTISHGLHSAKLEHLGLAAAAKSFCEEFGAHHKAQIEFRSHDVPRSLRSDISICMFRVLQEALQNALKHSHVQRFEVHLWAASDEIRLEVCDWGVGFDPTNLTEGTGLGLISMRERLKLVRGDFAIHSQPNCGTTIHARVPLELEQTQMAG